MKMNKIRQFLGEIIRGRHQGRRRYELKNELILAALPTLTILIVLVVLENFARQRILFASLASSAFLIYRDPLNQMNSLYSLLVSQAGGAVIGFGASAWLGEGYIAAALAMLATIIFIISLDAIHPPAISTTLSFAFRSPGSNLFNLFILALVMVALLVLLEQALLWFIRHLDKVER